ARFAGRLDLIERNSATTYAQHRQYHGVHRVRLTTRRLPMFALVVRFDLKDEDAAAGFDRLAAETLPGIQQDEPGTLVYATHRVEGEPLARVFYEVYRDRAAFDAHERQPHTLRFLSEREQYLSGVRVEFLDPLGNKGVSGS
ncbi:antibiotic biosynthesis monooxygenase, partial [Micromonospora sp. NPDC005367]|uniref:putative quinol monooxygenase n=1 Tax=Micromonospora sp. NPDC005367 TaxID=3155590 RepID=UPI0033B36C6F